jgi:hypothetical protein
MVYQFGLSLSNIRVTIFNLCIFGTYLETERVQCAPRAKQSRYLLRAIDRALSSA